MTSRNWLLIAGMLWLTFEYFVLGPGSYLRTHDTGDVFVPDLISYRFENLSPALWFRFAAGGTDRLAQGFFGIFDVMVFQILGAWLGYAFIVVGQIILASVFTYKLCRETLGLDRLPSTFAGLVFGLSSSHGLIFYSAMAYLPLTIWALSRALDGSVTRRIVTAIAIAIGYGGSAHAPFLIPFPLVVWVLWFVLVERRYRFNTFLFIVLVYALCLAVRAQDVLAMIGSADWSHRRLLGADEYVRWLTTFGWLDRITAVAVVPLCLAGVWQSRKNRGFGVVAMILLMYVGAWLFLAVSGPLGDLIPFAEKFNFSRILYFLAFPVAVLSGIGVALALRTNYLVRVARLTFRTGTAVVFVAFGVLFLASVREKVEHADDWVRNGSVKRNYASPAVLSFAEQHRHAQEPFRVASFQMVPSHMHAYGLETVGGYVTMYSIRYKEIWERIIAPYGARYPDKLSGFVGWGNRISLINDEPRERVQFRENYNLNLLSLANMKFIFSRDELIDDALVQVQGSDRPWNSRDQVEKIKFNVLANLTGLKSLYVYENLDVVPRFRFVSEVRVLPTDDQVLEALALSTSDEIKRAALMHVADAKGLPSDSRKFSEGRVSVALYESDRIVLEVEVDGAGFLAVSNEFHPAWRASVDGEPASILRTDHAFWGVPVPAGAQRVVFTYEPPLLPHIKLWKALAD